MNIYRSAPTNSMRFLEPEINEYIKAYYDLVEDCKDFPLWKRKLEEDLGQQVSMLAVMMDET